MSWVQFPLGAGVLHIVLAEETKQGEFSTRSIESKTFVLAVAHTANQHAYLIQKQFLIFYNMLSLPNTKFCW